MAQFNYKSKSRDGKNVSGTIEAENFVAAKDRLRLMGHQVKSIKQKGTAENIELLAEKPKGIQIQINLFKPKVTSTELAIFTKQLSVMIDSGVGLIQALSILGTQASNPRLKEVLQGVREGVENGKPLAEAMEKFSDVFDKLYISLIAAGASSGQMDVMLKKLSIYIEKSNKLKRQLVSAMTYPTIVIVVAIGMTTLMLLFVVPMLAKNFTENGKQLPWLTQFVLDISTGFRNYFVYIASGIFTAALFFKQWKNTPQGEAAWDNILLKIPVFGMVITKVSLARFSSTMATLTSSGIAILEALSICSRAAGNKTIEREIERFKNDVTKGKSLGSSMEKSRWFPPMVPSMVSIGEATGKMDIMLAKVAEFYEEEVDSTMAAALKLVEPIMFVVIGGIVGVVLIAMYLPVFDLGSVVSG